MSGALAQTDGTPEIVAIRIVAIRIVAIRTLNY